MALQQNISTIPGLQIFAKIPNGHGAAKGSPILANIGSVDHALGTVFLARGIPLAVSPQIDAAIVQNTMDGHSQLLYVSEHGQMTGAWLSVPGMSCIEFDKTVYLMQKDFDEYAFPIASK